MAHGTDDPDHFMAPSSRRPTERGQVGEAAWDLLGEIWALVFDVVVVDPSVTRGAQDPGQIELALTQRDVVLGRSVSGQVTDDSSTQVFEMHEPETFGIPIE
jgi:hypothetical protein